MEKALIMKQMDSCKNWGLDEIARKINHEIFEKKENKSRN